MSRSAPGPSPCLHPGVEQMKTYPLHEALRHRRSRRFALGGEIPAGPNRYRSAHAPVPLDEVEEALLLRAALGVTGPILADWPVRDAAGQDSGASSMMRFTGRSYPSACVSHGTSLVYWNDEATYLLRADRLPAVPAGDEGGADEVETLVRQVRAARVKLFDGRPRYPRSSPTMAPFNTWSSDVPGSTVFLPLADVTFFTINALLLICGWPDGGRFLVDDYNGNAPAGCARWAEEGLLNRQWVLPLSALENINAIEAGFLMQNLSLTLQAMGLGGWIHNHPATPVLLGGTPLAPGLGFRFVPPKVPQQPGGMAFAPAAVGRDGVWEAYCPPYYPSMDAAVDAVVAAKFGPQGSWSARGSEPSSLRDPEAFLGQVVRHDERVVQCVKDICNYVVERYGRFPARTSAIITPGSWLQAHHLDLEYYDASFAPGAYTELHARHMELWHGPEAEAWKTRLAPRQG
jgi:hypothetical protein